MPAILVLFVFAFLALCVPARSADWDPFSFMNKDSQNIIMPSSASQPSGFENFRQNNDWPQDAPVRQWQENKDGYTVSVPLRLPDDVDSDHLVYSYNDGTLTVKAPKKKLKSFI